MTSRFFRYRHFVPNISFGAPIVGCLRKHLPKGTAYFDCHLMVSNPAQWISDFKRAGADQITFHLEALNNDCKKAIELAQVIKSNGIDVGISIKPRTSFDTAIEALDSGITDCVCCCDSFFCQTTARSLLTHGFIGCSLSLPYLGLFHTLLVMTVEPGFGGQSFIEEMMVKVKTARERYPWLTIEVDGGLNEKTAKVSFYMAREFSFIGKYIQLIHSIFSADCRRKWGERNCGR